MANYLQKIGDVIKKLVKSGVLGLEDELFLRKVLKDFKHAVGAKDSRTIEKSVDKICKRLLEKIA